MIPEFYENCDIFVTGGSGIVGKALIDKLLRSCNVRCIYMLLRSKNNQNVEERLQQIRSAKYFRVLHAKKPNEFNKVIAIPGDVTLPNLGISPECAKLMANVSIVFHCAATIRFDEPIKKALQLNVGGTLEALKFAETLTKLKIFVHVSTFFSNPYLKYVEPKLYSSPMDWRSALELTKEHYPADLLDSITKKLIMGFPNTYTFTKNLAESLIKDYYNRLPILIFRPSIVVMSISEPEPSFPPSLIGPVGLFACIAAGVLKTIHVGNTTILDMTPLDIGTKAMLYYAMKTSEEYQKSTPDTVPVSMISSSTHCPYNFREICQIVEDSGAWSEVAFEKCFLIPGCRYTSNRFVYMFLVFTKQIIPAILGDCLLKLFGQKPPLMRIVRKAFVTLEVLKPFMFNTYESPGITDYANLCNNTNGTEFEIYDDVTNVATHEVVKQSSITMTHQIRELFLHEDPKTLKRAKTILNIKKFIYIIIRIVLVYYFLRWIYQYVWGG